MLREGKIIGSDALLVIRKAGLEYYRIEMAVPVWRERVALLTHTFYGDGQAAAITVPSHPWFLGLTWRFARDANGGIGLLPARSGVPVAARSALLYSLDPGPRRVAGTRRLPPDKPAPTPQRVLAAESQPRQVARLSEQTLQPWDCPSHGLAER